VLASSSWISPLLKTYQSFIYNFFIYISLNQHGQYIVAALVSKTRKFELWLDFIIHLMQRKLLKSLTIMDHWKGGFRVDRNDTL